MFDRWSELLSKSYRVARAVHGDLGVTLERFQGRIVTIAMHQIGPSAPDSKVGEFLSALHTNDLFLACACGDGLDDGWQRFHVLYGKYLADLARSLTYHCPDNEEIGQMIRSDLFLPDRSGKNKICSYDGRSSMATWLRVVVTNRVINDGQRKIRSGDLYAIPEPADAFACRRVEDGLGRERYQALIIDTFKRAFSTLSKRERLILLLHYDHGIPSGDIARLLRLRQSSITRRIDRTVSRLRKHVMLLLARQYQLGQPAIEECLAVLQETFTSLFSILGLIEDRAADAARQVYSSVNGRLES